jgi:iron complex outermembrane receptor protein
VQQAALRALPARRRDPLPAALQQPRRGIVNLTCQGNSSSALNALNLQTSARGRVDTGTGVLSYKPNDDTAALRQLFARLQGGRLQPRPLGARLARSSRRTIRAAANAASAPRTCSSTPEGRRLRARREADAAATSLFNVAASARSSALPAQHVQRLGLPRPEHQRLRTPTSAAATFNNITAIRRRRPAPARRTTSKPACARRASSSRRVPASATCEHRRLHLCRHQVCRRTGRQRHGRPLDPALFLLPGDNLSNAPSMSVTGSMPTRRRSAIGLSGLFYVDGR